MANEKKKRYILHQRVKRIMENSKTGNGIECAEEKEGHLH